MRHGFLKGAILASWRVLRCNPFCNGGADPVPPKGVWRNFHGKIGIFGGCFDPVHNAHIALAEAARDALGLDKVIFVPAAHSPLKDAVPAASGEIRLEMLEAAISGKIGFEVSDWDLEREGRSYSVETAQHFAKIFPFAEIFWILGDDQFQALDKWKDVEELSKIVRFAVMCRNENVSPTPPGDLAKCVCFEVLSVPPVNVSSTSLRERIQRMRFEEISSFVPEKVAKIILENNLYAKD